MYLPAQIIYSTVMYFLIMFLIPLISLIILNYQLMATLRRTRRRRESWRSSASRRSVEQNGQSHTSRRQDRVDRQWTGGTTEWTSNAEWTVSDQSTGGQSGQTVDREGNGVDKVARVDSLRPVDGRTEWTDSGQGGQRSGHRAQSGQSQTSRQEDRVDRQWTGRTTEWTSRAEWTVSDQRPAKTEWRVWTEWTQRTK